MKQKGRYNIKIAEKSGCEVQRVEFSQESLAIFIKLLDETIERDGFSGNSKAYYSELLQSRTHPNEGLYVATLNGIPVAAAILTITGKTAVYYYGASSSEADLRKYMPAYLLQWEMMRAAKQAGCAQYDFLGIASPDAKDQHLVGVSDFKAKFGGNIRVWPTKQIAILRPTTYFLYKILRILKGII